MRAITRGAAMVATRRSRPPQSGHARTSRPKVRRRSSARATAFQKRRSPLLGGGRSGCSEIAASAGRRSVCTSAAAPGRWNDDDMLRMAPTA